MNTPVERAGINLETVVSALEAHGLDARMGDEEGEPVIEVPCAEAEADDVIAQVETVLTGLEFQLVPEKADGRIFLRPPAA